MGGYFKGYYLKHQVGDFTIAFIPSISVTGGHLQIITNDFVEYYDYPMVDLTWPIRLANNTFALTGINIDTPRVQGVINYSSLTHLPKDIMGPFLHLPIPCKHGITSLHHHLSGYLVVDGKMIDFTGGVGYIESDYGSSFPQRYLWLQTNSFKQKASVMVAVATIELAVLKFWGTLAVVLVNNQQYTLTTYQGVKIVSATPQLLHLKQREFELIIKIEQAQGYWLKAPKGGSMSQLIKESNQTISSVRFYRNQELLLDEVSYHTSFEDQL
jgi:tocopherol cyclase